MFNINCLDNIKSARSYSSIHEQIAEYANKINSTLGREFNIRASVERQRKINMDITTRD